MTTWETERWRKLFVREPKDQEIWDWQTRGLRDLLIRVAEDDGRLGKDVSALKRLLRAGAELDEHVRTLLEDGFLVQATDGLYVRNLPTAQAQRAPRAPREPSGTGGKGGGGRWANTTQEERKSAAKRASEARWGRRIDASGDASPDASTDDATTDVDASGDASGPRAVSDSSDPSESSGKEREKREEKTRVARAHASTSDASPDASTDDASSHSSSTPSDKETIVPLDLVERARKAGVFTDLLTGMPGVVAAQLERKAGFFVAYWSIGGGAGKKRRHWMAKLRQDLVESFQQGKLPDVSVSAPVRRPPVVIQREVRPIEMGEVPADILEKISPPRPVLRPVLNAREEIERLRVAEQSASTGHVEPEAADA